MKQKVVKHFNYIAPKTVYRQITELVEGGELFQAEDKHTLTLTKQGIGAKWPTHRILKEFSNYSTISNMYACRDERLKALTNYLMTEYGEPLARIMLDLQILGTVAAIGFELSEGFEQKNEAILGEVDMDALKARFQKLASIG